ncbi:MAG: response regulator [Alphaproteobacteria bacterium]
MITVTQIKAGRVMLQLNQKELAERAGISVATLNNIERGAQTDPKISTMKAIQKALEADGIEFITQPLGGIGVLYKPKRSGAGEAVILIVDDSKADRALYKSWLKGDTNTAYQIIEASSAREGHDAFMEHQPDCVILDFMMYGADGFQLLTALKREPVRLPPIIFVTGMHTDVLEKSARSQGVYTYLHKNGLTKDILCEAVKRALHS